MSRREIPPCSKTYGFPVYCSSWISLDRISCKNAATKEAEEEVKNEISDEGISAEKSSGEEEKSSDELLLVLGGGGGEGRSGVPNVILVARYDLSSRSLEGEPVHRMGTKEELPYRMTVHPGGEGILFAFPNGCRFFDWKTSKDTEKPLLEIKSSERILSQLENAGLQLTLAFDSLGSLLAAGGEDGHMRVFKWPSMELILEQIEVEKSVKDLNFGCGGKFLACVSSSGFCSIWDLDSRATVENLARENREKFLFCRFSLPVEGDAVLYTLSAQGQFACISSWSTTTWKKLTSKNVSKDPVSAFNVSPNGNFLAIGTIEGDVVVLNSKLQVHSTVKRAHLGLVTTVVFSHDSSFLLSTSFDSFSRVTTVEKQNAVGRIGWNLWIIMFVILLAILAYYIKERGSFTGLP